MPLDVSTLKFQVDHVCVKITDLIYEYIFILIPLHFVCKMTTNLTEQIASSKTPFVFFHSSVYFMSIVQHIRVLLSILQILRGHMTYFVTFRRKRYENVCEIYGTYIK